MFAGFNLRNFRLPVYRADQVPQEYQEKYIFGGYRRPNSTPLQCLLSLFGANNETLNVWTHLLPSLCFMWIVKGLLEELDFRNDSYLWPLLPFLCMWCLYPLVSSLAHMFSTMSTEVRHVWYCVDYNAVSLYCVCAAVACRAYMFPASWRQGLAGQLYLPLVVVNNLLSMVLSCLTRFMPLSPTRTALRLAALGGPCIFAMSPVFYRLAVVTSGDPMSAASWSSHFRTGYSIIFAGLLYGSHLPERLFPGKFDVIGHSHQLFHMVLTYGTWNQFYDIYNDMKERRAMLEKGWEFESLGSSVGLVALVVLVNVCIIVFFSWRLCGKNKQS